MSNLQTATLAIEAEIVHANNGLAYYAARVQALEQALAERPEKESAELPSTGGAYWPNLLTDQGQHSSAILKSAIDQLGFTPTKTQIKKLTQRMTFALNALVKTKKIQDSGSGRDRLFFKK